MVTAPHRIALAGCGNVGQALVRLIAEEHPAARGLVVAAVSDLRYGTVVSELGIDAGELLSAFEGGSLSGLEGHVASSDVLEAIDACEADTLVELTFTDLETGEPALAHIRHALSAGMNVSTTNKGPIALHLDELERLAADHDVVLAYEGTVMSGSPALLTAAALRDAGFEGAEGILNGTTNYVITRMEEGCSYADALAEAPWLCRGRSAGRRRRPRRRREVGHSGPGPGRDRPGDGRREHRSAVDPDSHRGVRRPRSGRPVALRRSPGTP